MNLEFQSEQAMLVFASELAKFCEPPLVIFLTGQLGAGKTTFSRGFLSGLGYDGKVKSPTYSLVEAYHFPNYIVFHFDFYRIYAAEELEFIGIRDYFQPNTICLIEWPEQGKGKLPAPDIICHFEVIEPGRKLELTAKTRQGNKIIKRAAVPAKQ